MPDGCHAAAIEHRFNRAYGTDLSRRDPRPAYGSTRPRPERSIWSSEHFTAAGLEPPRLVQEPGRSLTGDTQLLLTSVVDVKLDSKPPHAVLDAGINIAEPVPNEYHQLFSVSAPTAPAARSYRLAGPICTPADVLYNHWRLPELDVGHVLAIMDSGAYFVPFSTTFSFPTAAVVMQDGSDVGSACRRESFDDIVALDSLPAASEIAGDGHGKRLGDHPDLSSRAEVVDAVRSVLAEDIEALQVLVVDDSPEQSARQAVTAVDDSRVRYLTMPSWSGGRPARVRNWAMAQATGDILYFLDDDDTVVPGGLTKLVTELARRPRAGVAFGRLQPVGPDRTIVGDYVQYFEWAGRTARRLRRSSWLTTGAIMFRGTLIVNSVCAIRRQLALDLNGYDTELAVYEDVEFFTRAMRKGGHVFVDYPVLNYSTGAPSLIHDLKGDQTLVHESNTAAHLKLRRAHAFEYRVLQVVAKLLPIGTYA